MFCAINAQNHVLHSECAELCFALRVRIFVFYIFNLPRKLMVFVNIWGQAFSCCTPHCLDAGPLWWSRARGCGVSGANLACVHRHTLRQTSIVLLQPTSALRFHLMGHKLLNNILVHIASHCWCEKYLPHNSFPGYTTLYPSALYPYFFRMQSWLAIFMQNC